MIRHAAVWIVRELRSSADAEAIMSLATAAAAVDEAAEL